MAKNSEILEILEISEPVDQELAVQYGTRSIVFGIKWNETLGQWALTVKENGAILAAGVTMSLNSNLLYDKFNIGKLFLIDTYQGTPQEGQKVVKNDLGARLALARVWLQGN